MYIAEKSLQVEVVALDLHTDNRTPEFCKKNPMGNLPVLELDDGTCISETMAICRYLEALFPEPRLFGESALEIATVEMWNRRSEFSFYLPIEFAGGFFGADVARGARQRVDKIMRLFDRELESRRFIAGETLSVADITTKVAIDFGVHFNEITVPEDVQNFRRWNAEMDSRPSVEA
jgi:glutathione S-transferase